MTPKQRAAMEQVLEWDKSRKYIVPYVVRDAISAALAEQPTKPQWPETLAEALYRYGTDFMCHSASRGIDDIEEAGCLMVQASKKLAEQEPCGWQFFQDGRWHNGSDRHDHRKHTEAAGFQTRDVYPAPQPAKHPFLVRDIAELIGSTVPDVCNALEDMGIEPRRSTNAAVTPDEALAVARRLAQPAKRVPLTDDEIDAISDDHRDWTHQIGAFRRFARAIEAAHGIKGETT